MPFSFGKQFADKEVAVPSFSRRASVIDADRVDEPPQDPGKSADAAEALALAEEAEAEAAEAEAIAAAARARARAIRLRRQAHVAESDASAEVEGPDDAEADVTDADVEAEVKDAVAEPVEVTEADTEDSEEDVAEEPEEDVAEEPEEVPVRRLRRWRLGRILKVLAATVAIACTAALITLSVLMVIGDRHQAAEQQRRAEFAAAGRQSVVTLMSLDFNKAKDDVQRIIDNSTGTFKDDFKIQAEDFVKVAQDSKVITEVTVNSTAVESMTNDSAVVLVSATSRVTNSAGAKQEPRSWRLSVNLQREGDQIKMSKVEFVP
jgi:Mce-associated membrane protein